MKMIKNLCYDCPRPCAGCGRCHAEVVTCDDCGDEGAKYNVDDEDLCEDCLIKRVKKDLESLSRNIEKKPYLYLLDTAKFLYDEVEEFEEV